MSLFHYKYVGHENISKRSTLWQMMQVYKIIANVFCEDGVLWRKVETLYFYLQALTATRQ